MMLTHYFVAFIITALTELATGIFVYLKGPKRLVNVMYFFYAAAVAWWSGFEAFSITIPSRALALFLWRINHIGVIFIPIFFVHFVTSLLGDCERQKRKRLILSSYVAGIGFLMLDYTDLLILEVVPKFSFRYFINPGSFYSLFFFVWICWALYGLVLLFKVYARSTGIQRKQLRYFCWPMLIAYIGGVPNFFPTFNIEIPGLMPFGTYAIPVYSLATGYSIVQFGLMDIRVAVTRTGLLLGTYLVVLGVPFVVGWWGRGWLEQRVGQQWWLVPLGLCTVLATVGPFAYAYLRRQAEERLLRGQRRYQRTLQHAARGMTQVRSLSKLTKLIVRVVSRTVRVQHASLFLWDKETQRYLLAASHGPKRLAIQSRYGLEPSHELIQWLREHRKVLSREEPPQGSHPVVEQELAALRAALIVPGLIEDELVGFLVLGEKLSGAGYSSDDLHAFSTLAHEAAIAIENAKSYEELLKVNQQLRVAYDRLVEQERMVAAGQFATGMAHEIKNPLSAIKTFAEYLPEKYDDPAFRDKFFRIVQSEIERINTIVKELLDFAKPAPLQVQPVQLSQLLDETLAFLSNQLLKHGVELLKNFSDNGTTIQADPKQLKQVLLNILLNSLEAMPAGGRLQVSTQVLDGRMTLRVTDTGCGIPEEYHSKLFDPFFTTKERGMGLGLAIVKGVVERHGGEVAIRSQPGKGTTVEVRLPVTNQL